MKTFHEWLEEKGVLEESIFTCQKCNSQINISGVSEPEKIHCKKCGGEMSKVSAKAA